MTVTTRNQEPVWWEKWVGWTPRRSLYGGPGCYDEDRGGGARRALSAASGAKVAHDACQPLAGWLQGRGRERGEADAAPTGERHP